MVGLTESSLARTNMKWIGWSDTVLQTLYDHLKSSRKRDRSSVVGISILMSYISFRCTGNVAREDWNNIGYAPRVTQMYVISFFRHSCYRPQVIPGCHDVAPSIENIICIIEPYTICSQYIMYMDNHSLVFLFKLFAQKHCVRVNVKKICWCLFKLTNCFLSSALRQINKIKCFF